MWPRCNTASALGEVLHEFVDGAALTIGLREGWLDATQAADLARVRFRRPRMTYVKGMLVIMSGCDAEHLGALLDASEFEARCTDMTPN